MKRKAQMRWSIVGYRGHINTGYLAFTRKGVIENVLKEYAGFRERIEWAKGLSDAQFWRKLKRRRGWTVRRVALRVAR